MKRSKEWWERRIAQEPDGPIGAGSAPCPHLEFSARVAVHRLTKTEEPDAEVTGWMAELRVECSACGRNMQFLGLPAGVDTGGATVSVDGLEARLAMVPQGGDLSALDRVAAILGNTTRETH